MQQRRAESAHALGSTRTFDPGQIVITAHAQQVLDPADVQIALARHLAGNWGDWGDCEPDDRQENDLALQEVLRLFSVYHTRDGRKFWIITEADRSATTVLLPDDY